MGDVKAMEQQGQALQAALEGLATFDMLVGKMRELTGDRVKKIIALESADQPVPPIDPRAVPPMLAALGLIAQDVAVLTATEFAYLSKDRSEGTPPRVILAKARAGGEQLRCYLNALQADAGLLAQRARARGLALFVEAQEIAWDLREVMEREAPRNG